MVKFYPVIEYDPNMGMISDVVTEEYAKDLHVGDEILAVVLDRGWTDLDWSTGARAVITKKIKISHGWSIRAEFINDSLYND